MWFLNVLISYIRPYFHIFIYANSNNKECKTVSKIDKRPIEGVEPSQPRLSLCILIFLFSENFVPSCGSTTCSELLYQLFLVAHVVVCKVYNLSNPIYLLTWVLGLYTCKWEKTLKLLRFKALEAYSIR